MMSEELNIYASSNVAIPPSGTATINPAALRRTSIAETHAINEDLFRQVLREHWPVGLGLSTPSGGALCACGHRIAAEWNRDAQRDWWIDHVMRVAAVTPLVVEGASL